MKIYCEKDRVNFGAEVKAFSSVQLNLLLIMTNQLGVRAREHVSVAKGEAEFF
jgi:hypothetical protein